MKCATKLKVPGESSASVSIPSEKALTAGVEEFHICAEKVEQLLLDRDGARQLSRTCSGKS
jgi:hypothetical protein